MKSKKSQDKESQPSLADSENDIVENENPVDEVSAEESGNGILSESSGVISDEKQMEEVINEEADAELKSEAEISPKHEENEVEESKEFSSNEDPAEVPVDEDSSEMKDETEISLDSGEVLKDSETTEENISAEAATEGKDETEKEGKNHAASENAIYLSEQIDKLIKLKEENNFVDFWFYVKELNNLVFRLHGVHRGERTKFKERISELCDEVKKTQDELKVKVAKTSQIKLDRINQILEEAFSFGTSHEEMEKSFHKIEEANKFLKEGVVKGTDGEESADMSRVHRDQAKEAIKAAKDKIFDRKRELREKNFKRVTDRLTKLSDQLMAKTPAGKIFDGVKQLRAEMRNMALDRSQVREIDNVIETIWKKAKEKLTVGRESDTKGKISWLEGGIHRKQQFMVTLEKEIKELDIKWASVKNDFFKGRVNEWIEEKKEKIEETKKEIESAQEKIKFLKEQMERE